MTGAEETGKISGISSFPSAPPSKEINKQKKECSVFRIGTMLPVWGNKPGKGNLHQAF